MKNLIRNSENRIRNSDEEKWTARDMAYRPGGLSQSKRDYRTRYDRPCYECGSMYCPANCKDTAQPDLAQVGEVGVWGERKWVGLTTAERKALWNATRKPSEFAELIEAKLKEKNT